MIFASDLDRTLIYSKRALSELNQTQGELVQVESLNNHKSYMSRLSLEILQELSKRILFVPVTARSYSQYKRLILPQIQLKNKHFITSNGACIYINGKKDGNWDQILRRRMNDLSFPIQKIEELLKRENRLSSLKVNQYHDLYYNLIGLNPQIKQGLRPLFKQIKAMGWQIFIHKKKVYILPPFLQKGEAIHYLKEKLAEEVRWAAGDSAMDYSLLNVSEQKFVPRHGELADQSNIFLDWELTKSEGIKATEEMLMAIYKQVC